VSHDEQSSFLHSCSGLGIDDETFFCIFLFVKNTVFTHKVVLLFAFLFYPACECCAPEQRPADSGHRCIDCRPYFFSERLTVSVLPAHWSDERLTLHPSIMCRLFFFSERLTVNALSAHLYLTETRPLVACQLLSRRRPVVAVVHTIYISRL